MIIFGIETSCDETSAALVEDGTKILSNVIASSQELHIKTHGVIPEVAAREQVKCIIPVIKGAFKQTSNFKFQISERKPEDFIDAIAVTVGPGLIGSLLVGVETAKTLAYVWQKPIVPVNHLIGHVYTNFVGEMQSDNANLKINKIDFKKIFPAIVLIVSGGHTELLLMTGHGKYKWLGGARDDAAGECFDKCARILGLPYPGGPAIAACAANFRIPCLVGKRANFKFQIKLPRPMIGQKNFDFSFSGLKTALINLIKNNGIMSSLNEVEGKQLNNLIPFLAFEVQESITDVLVYKTIRASEKYHAKSIIISGGVAANQRLREKFQEEIKKSGLELKFFAPPPELCTDNAVGIASAAFFNFKPVPWQKISADSGLEIT